MTPAEEMQLLFQYVTKQQVQDSSMDGTTATPAETEGSSSKEERPAKWPKENSKGDSRRGKGNTGQRSDQGRKRQEWGSKWEDGDRSDNRWNRDLDNLKDSIQLLARISLRHEDELAQSRVEKEFVLTFEVHGGGILPLMWGFAQEWKKAREEKKVFSSLPTLFLAFLQEWKLRLDRMDQKEAQESWAWHSGIPKTRGWNGCISAGTQIKRRWRIRLEQTL